MSGEGQSPELRGAEAPPMFGGGPATWADAYLDSSPTDVLFDLGGNGSATPYTAAVNGMLLKHLDEVKQKSLAAVSLPQGWKKRLREFLASKNTELLDFMALSVTSHPTLGKGETILRKFGNTNLHANHPTVKDLVMDASGADVVGEIAATLVSLRKEGGDGLKEYMAATRYIFDTYREAGEEALKAEQALRQRLDVLDKVKGRLTGILDLDPTEAYAPLMEATEGYLDTMFKKHQIEEHYRGVIAAYRRFIALRDVVLMTRSIHAQENEPLCTICLHDSVAYCMAPCGHTFCANCIRKQTGVCFMCRTPIREKVKLFFG